MMQETKNNILVVYGSISVRQTIIDSLDDGYVTQEASSGEEAWKLIESTDDISVVFVDMNMPTMDSLLLLKKIRATESQRIANLPVIIITEHENSEAAKYVSDIIGATGFISKPIDSSAILNLVNSYARLNNNVPESKQIDTNDKITGCLNERSFTEYCSGLLEYANYSYEDTSLLCIQVMGLDDAFKNLDESVAEQIIMAIAEYLNQACRRDEKVAYLGAGRFFVVLLTTNVFRAQIAGMRLQKKISSLKFRIDDTRIRVKAAIGISATNSSESQYTFDVLRLQAEQAVQISLELPDSPIVRYDAKFEKGYDEELHQNQIQLKKKHTV
ncbi:MAG: response regulator [Gammaproteobacteria bacterium]|nr:response regulator [Gammaproteobacteria bacterium]MCK5262273.1 response regulator [Gammaproteobacteria bacterium]